MNIFERLNAETLRGRITKALEVAGRYGGIDGGHHKQWVIDQMVRALTDGRYARWVEDYEGENGEHGEWDVGITP